MDTLDDLDAWVAENGIDAFNRAMTPGGAFNSKNKDLGFVWRQREAARDEERRHQAAVEREERAVQAAERSADASERAATASETSAAAASKSARWAWAAAVIALAGLAVMAWPFSIFGH